MTMRVPPEQQLGRGQSVIARVLARILAGVFRGGIACVGGVCRVAANPVRRRYVRHYHPMRPHARKHLTADLVFVGAILALIGVNAYVFFARPRPAPSNVQLAFASTTIDALTGASVDLRLVYRHAGRERLDTVTVAFAFPETFIPLTITGGAYDRTTTTLTMNPIAAGVEGAVTLRGLLLASKGTAATIDATLHGRGLTTVERTIARTTIAASGIALAPRAALPMIPVRGEATGTLEVEDAQGFDAVTLTPQPIAGITAAVDPWVGRRMDRQWSAPVHVRTAGAPVGTHTLPMAVHVEHGGRSWELGTVGLALEVIEAPFRIVVRRLGSGALALGAAESFTVEYAYAGTEFVGGRINARIGAELRGALLSGTRILAIGGRVMRGAPQWELSDLRAMHTQTFTIQLPRQEEDAAFSADTAFEYTVVPTMSYEVQMEPQSVTVEGEGIVVPVRGELKVATFARYFSPEGDQLGRGPLPPRVGKPTKYWLTWDVRSIVEHADRVVVRAALPEGVEWTGKTATTAGDHLIYDPGIRMVTWTIGALERTTGKDPHAVTASFEVALVPRDVQVGAFAPLLGATRVEGAGQATSEALSADSAAVTTELPHDAYARGKGRVMTK